jgi:hypothetical protein
MPGPDWISDKIPPWVLLILAVLGAPSSIGLAVWNQNAENQLSRIEEHLVYIDRDRHEAASRVERELAELQVAVAQRVAISQRAEMMVEYERRFRAIEAQIDRLEDRIYDGGPGGPYNRIRPYQEDYDRPSTDPRE